MQLNVRQLVNSPSSKYVYSKWIFNEGTVFIVLIAHIFFCSFPRVSPAVRIQIPPARALATIQLLLSIVKECGRSVELSLMSFDHNKKTAQLPTWLLWIAISW